MVGTEKTIYLYPETIAMAIGVILYTVGSAVAAALTHILYRMNGKKVVYVSLLSISAFIQQFFTIAHVAVQLARWPQIQIEEYNLYLQQWKDPKTSIGYSTSANSVIKAIFAVRMYFFNVGSLLFFFWSFMLLVSVWEMPWAAVKSTRFISISKWACFVLPLLITGLTNMPFVLNIPILHIALANCILVSNLGIGSIFMGFILYKCARVRLGSSWGKEHIWKTYDNGESEKTEGPFEIGSSYIPDQPPAYNREPIVKPEGKPEPRSKEDRYIIIRFIFGFITIACMQSTLLLSQWVYAKSVRARTSLDAPKPTPGWTKDAQLSDWSFFFAGSSNGYLILLVFGTTLESRVQMRRIWARFRTGKWPNEPVNECEDKFPPSRPPRENTHSKWETEKEAVFKTASSTDSLWKDIGYPNSRMI
ncbi:hypothetical protein EDC01DRAFT_681620 [Geopyxis carbonaria]|nr:hypothetical protein EDC01DRAFT_681620 [Geopyxis carbonaria]